MHTFIQAAVIEHLVCTPEVYKFLFIYIFVLLIDISVSSYVDWAHREAVWLVQFWPDHYSPS